jgi:hypothetical protein
METPIAYIEPPTIPAGMTVAQYRRSRRLQRRSLMARLRSPLRAPGQARRPLAA